MTPTATKPHNPYTRIRQQAAELQTYQANLRAFQQAHEAHVRAAGATLENANMDIDLLMTIVREIRPWCYPGSLDSIVREHITRRGVSPATNDLVGIIEDTRQGFFLPIAKPVPLISDARPLAVVTMEAQEKLKAFGFEEEEEEEKEGEETFLFGEPEVDEEAVF